MLQLFIAAILIFCNALFALSELAIVSSRKPRLEALAAEGGKGARIALQLMENPGRFLSTVQIGITLVGVLAGAFSGAALGADAASWLRGLGVKPWLAESAGYALVLGLITYFSVVIGELVPKHLALRNPEPVACIMAPAMMALSKLAAPLVWLLDGSARLVIRLLGSAPEEDARISDEEIRALIAEAARTGVIAVGEREMMAAVMRFGDRTVRSIMTPRVEVSFVDLDGAPDEIAAQIKAYSHSTLLVCESGPDHIAGIVRFRDLADRMLTSAVEGHQNNTALTGWLRNLIHKVPAIPDSVSAMQALEALRSASVPLAIVRDEYGNFEGIVTPADILDALAGAFRSDTLPREPDAKQRLDGGWDLSGMMPADEMSELLGIKLPDHRGFETLGGYLISRLGAIPGYGDTVEADDWRFTIVSMKDLRIENVTAQRMKAAE